jgi:hypothetical protein
MRMGWNEWNGMNEPHAEGCGPMMRINSFRFKDGHAEEFRSHWQGRNIRNVRKRD